MKYQELLSGMARFGATHQDICMLGLGVSPEHVRENVVIAPWWEPAVLPDLGTTAYLSASAAAPIKVWDISNPLINMTYIKTGIGAPVLMDALLALGVTPCRRIIFIGSVGALDASIGIGDIVIPEYSISGDGASRYIFHENLQQGDVYGKKAYPDEGLTQNAAVITKRLCSEHDVKWHSGRVFSIDTIFAEYAHIDEIIATGCNVIEEETAAGFRAAALMGIPMTALFSVSDNTVTNKSLVCGRTPEEMDYRRKVRRELFPKIILEVFGNRCISD